jgi:hypothetical protein
MGFIDEQQLDLAIGRLGKSKYAAYLKAVADEAV